MSDTQEQPERVPQQWEHVKIFYAALAKESRTIIEDDQEVLRYEGQVTKFFMEVCPKGHYGKVREALLRLRCIRIQGRGGGKDGLSMWYLLQDPESAMADPIQSRVALHLLNDSSVDGKFRALNERLSNVERELVNQHRLIKLLQGQTEFTVPYEPTEGRPPRRQPDVELLQSLVDTADKLEGE